MYYISKVYDEFRVIVIYIDEVSTTQGNLLLYYIFKVYDEFRVIVIYIDEVSTT